MKRSRALLLLLSMLGALTATAAQAETVAVIRPSFTPNRLGATSALTFALQIRGPGREVPAPLKASVLHLPAGLEINLRGVGICKPSRLRAHGPRGCPTGSRVGRGSAVLEAELGALTIPENASLQAFRGPNRRGHPVLEISGQGLTPLEERITFSGVLLPDSAPYGEKLAMSIPAIPTIPEEPNASTVKFSLTLDGASDRHAGAIRLPRHCPAGGFQFAQDLSFVDGTSTTAHATARCP